MKEQNVDQETYQESDRKKRRAIIIAAIILLLIVGVTIGYAGLSTGLNINGTTKIDETRWKICFTRVAVKSGSVTAEVAPSVDPDGCTTSVDYSVKLQKLGDFYEFDIDVENLGTLDGQAINTVKKSFLNTFVNISFVLSLILSP